jgi:hypothetical protein
MFLKTEYPSKGGTVPRYINLMQVATMGACSGKRAEEGFKTVLWMAGSGYAMYSRLSPEEIADLFDFEIADGTLNQEYVD